jgi:predicted GNAT superfamily acetyltransferase
VGVVAGEGRDGRTRLLQRRRVENVAFVLEPLQRAAHGRAANAELGGDLRFDDAGSWREAPRDDELAQLLVNALRARAEAPRRAAGGPATGRRATRCRFHSTRARRWIGESLCRGLRDLAGMRIVCIENCIQIMPVSTDHSTTPQESSGAEPQAAVMPDAATDPADVTLRRLETLEEYEEACALQDEIWGAGFNDRVPAAILRVAQKVGGVSAGAFDTRGRMLGFVFGLTGVRGGRLVHWSDMLAVREVARGRHLGDRLKQYQRELVRAIGVEVMLWTFDPLVARNAHFNLNRLGARVVEYVPNLYGSNTGSVLHGGMPTDRFVAEWDIDPAPDAERATIRPRATGVHADAAASPAQCATVVHAHGVTLADPLPGGERVRIQVPYDINAVAAAGGDAALAWRFSTRDAFLHYLTRGYRVTAFDRGSDQELPAYELTPEPTRHDTRPQ